MGRGRFRRLVTDWWRALWTDEYSDRDMYLRRLDRKCDGKCGQCKDNVCRRMKLPYRVRWARTRVRNWWRVLRFDRCRSCALSCKSTAGMYYPEMKCPLYTWLYGHRFRAESKDGFLYSDNKDLRVLHSNAWALSGYSWALAAYRQVIVPWRRECTYWKPRRWWHRPLRWIRVLR